MIRRRTVDGWARPALAGVLTLAVAAGLSACGGKTAAAPAYGSGSGAPSIAQITPMLTRHAQAVTARSSARFLADVDTSDAAGAFRQQQATEITALSSVPLRLWSYAVSSPVTDLTTVRAAAKRFGAPATILHLTLSYELAVDQQPVTHDLWWTFVQRHGHVFVAGDSDLTGLGGQTWHGPWDFGPLVVHRGASSLVIAHPASAGELPAISAQVDAAVTAVSAVWGTDWNRQVAVEIPGTPAEFTALGGVTSSAKGGADYSAETIFETSNGADSAARVLLNPGVLGRLTPTGRAIVLRHEITHAATIASTSIGTPSWLVEGFADYVGNLGSGQSTAVAATELRAEVRKGQLPTALPSDSAFAATDDLAPVYEQAWLACRLIATKAGQAGLVHFYRLVGAGLDTAAAAVASAMQTVLHESVAAFVAQWRAYLVTELR